MSEVPLYGHAHHTAPRAHRPWEAAQIMPSNRDPRSCFVSKIGSSQFAETLLGGLRPGKSNIFQGTVWASSHRNPLIQAGPCWTGPPRAGEGGGEVIYVDIRHEPILGKTSLKRIPLTCGIKYGYPKCAVQGSRLGPLQLELQLERNLDASQRQGRGCNPSPTPSWQAQGNPEVPALGGHDQVVKVCAQPPPPIQFSLFLLRTGTFWGQNNVYIYIYLHTYIQYKLSQHIQGGVFSQEDTLQGHLAHKRQPHRRTLHYVGLSLRPCGSPGGGVAVSYERGTPV